MAGVLVSYQGGLLVAVGNRSLHKLTVRASHDAYKACIRSALALAIVMAIILIVTHTTATAVGTQRRWARREPRQHRFVVWIPSRSDSVPIDLLPGHAATQKLETTKKLFMVVAA